MTMLMTNICVCIILLVCLYMSIMTVTMLIRTKPESFVEYIARIRKLLMWTFFVSIFVLLMVCSIMSSTYCTQFVIVRTLYVYDITIQYNFEKEESQYKIIMKIDVGFNRKENPKEYDKLWRRKYNKITANVKRKLGDYKYIDKCGKYPTICDYTYEELLHTLSTNKCTYCGSINNLGLDRINNNKGHTKDNTVVACYRCNSIRGNKYTVEEAKELIPLFNRMRSIELEIEKIIDRKKKAQFK